MTIRKLFVVAIWALSLVAVAQWTTRAQVQQLPGVEVRFLPGTGKPGAPTGSLVANVNGQWLPVTLDGLLVPDGNARTPRR